MFTALHKQIDAKPKRLGWSFASLSFFYVVCNGYRFFHQAFAGDALLMIHQNDAAWQIALGRFFQPVLIMCRGGLETPFLISVLAILWLSLSVYFFCEVFSLDTPLHFLCIGALFGSNISLIVANASFLPWVDFYALALLFSILSVWLWSHFEIKYFFVGIVLLALSMGIYQAYVCVALGMLILIFLKKFSQAPMPSVAAAAVLYGIPLAASFLLYFVTWKIFQRIFHIWTSDSYNGLSSVGNYSGQSIPSLFLATYRHVWDYLWNPDVYVTMSFRGVSLSLVVLWGIRLCNLLILLLLILRLLTLLKKLPKANRIFSVLLFLLFPFGINFVCFLSKDMEHSLMIFAFCLIYAAVPILTPPSSSEQKYDTLWQMTRRPDPIPRGASEAADRILRESSSSGETDSVSPDRKKTSSIAFIIAIVAVVWTNIIFANQLYLKRELQEEAAHSLMTRILYEIEHTPGYEPGITPVAFSGSFETTPYTDNPNVFSDLHPWGVGHTSMTYIGTDYAYLEYVLNAHLNLTRIDAADVANLPVYPSAGSVSFIGDTLVVKISDI